MKIPQPRYPSPLGRMQPESVDLDAVKQRGWQDQHILVVSDADERLDYAERQLIRRIGERLSGRSRHG
jgi:hypothetical protein